MKRLLVFVVVMITSCFLMVGCSFDNAHDPIGDNTEETGGVTDTVEGTEANLPLQQGGQDEYYSEKMQLEFLSALNEYVGTDIVSETLLRSYSEADAVRAIPVLGTYLEETNLVLYMFYKDTSFCSTATLEFDVKGDPIDIELVEFASTDPDNYYYVDAISNESSCLAIMSCIEALPDFEILGIVYNNSGYPMPIPIGRAKGDETIKYFMNQEPTAFNLVEPFETIEKGRIAFAKYLAEREEIKAQLPKFLWETEKFYEGGFWNAYSLDYVFDDNEENINKTEYIRKDAESRISLPLLDEELNEGVLISHLLYYRNKLIGEVVISCDPQDNLAAVYFEVAQKTDDGAYIPMVKSEYQKAIEKARELYPNVEIEGVMFKDGTYIPFGYQDGETVLMTG